MKKILGLDLGTNSIGWSLIEQDFENKQGKILGMGSRIIPMTQDIKDEFGKGNSISQTAERTRLRGVRRLFQRGLLRRERLHRVLHVLDFLPEHYDKSIDFEQRFGQFFHNTEPKINCNQDGFLFEQSYQEMLQDFKRDQPKLVSNNKKIPHDWTIYYLRKKALTKKISKEELAWLLLNFNQKRGYYQLRGEEEEENPNKQIEFHSLRIVEVKEDEKNARGDQWYSLILENGWIYRRSSKVPLTDWKDKTRDFIVTTDLNDDGTIKLDKEGNEKRSFRAPKEDDWTLVKKKTEHEIEQSKKTVGEYIYEAILKQPNQKIRGKLISTIERKFYKNELKQILKTQIGLHAELQDKKVYEACVFELYKKNEAHRSQLMRKGFEHLFIEDILFYQRPLKSQKGMVSSCPLEFRSFVKDGIQVTEGIKVVSKSNPVYQEFRVWQWLYNLKIYHRESDVECTIDFLNSTLDYESLFEFLLSKKEIKQEVLLKYFIEKQGLKGKALNNEIQKYRWNYVDDKIYPCNETSVQIQSRLEKVVNLSKGFTNSENVQKIWHIIYSVSDKVEYEKALSTFAKKHSIDVDSFVENFKKFPPFKSDFGAYSEKAIRKLLPLMRIGKFWNHESFDDKIKDRMSKLLSGEFDEEIANKVREKSIHLKSESDFQGLQLWLAQYIVYGRHSEALLAGKWKSSKDLEVYLKEFKQHSLRNPIVEQIVSETLRVVKDIWDKYGKGATNYFDEIHVELGREMKNTSEERKRMTAMVTENENTNLRIKALLAEMVNDPSVENVRPYSPSQQEALKIFEEGALNSNMEVPDDIAKISKTAQPSSSELQKYKLWLEQKYRSPYTGQIIPLTKLFTADYEIEHVIPQSRFFDDSFTNKVICESAVNKLKNKQLGLEFIKNHRGQKVDLGFGKSAEIFSEEAYEEFVKEHYAKNRSKRNKLLMDEIPEKMIDRQMNDTRYISKFVSTVLSNIVRSENNDEGPNSKNVLPGNGKITTKLKQDWGLNDVWNDLILPRFERMNEITNTKDFTSWNEKHQKFLPTVPLEHSKGFSKKRIDHRHHAMDALVVACATRNHISLLNNEHAESSKRYDLNRKLRKFEKISLNGETKEVAREFEKPWKDFTVEARNALDNIVVSFKQNLRVINKTSNKTQQIVEEKGRLVKKMITQTKGDSWAIRKPMHKDTVSGQIHLDRIKVPNGKILTATRKPIDSSFNLKTIESITDTGIKKILMNYLNQEKYLITDKKGGTTYDFELAFSPEGLEDLNKNISVYNDGKPHKPIHKVRLFELGSKFALGQSGNKSSKFVEAAKGTNLFFAIYQDSDGKRTYETIPLNIVIERQKQGLSSVPETNEKGHNLLFHLSPNDLVYVKNDESQLTKTSDLKQFECLYKMVSSSSYQCFFVPQSIASSIVNKVEFSSLNKSEKSIDAIMIKDKCLKVQISRLGEISLLI